MKILTSKSCITSVVLILIISSLATLVGGTLEEKLKTTVVSTSETNDSLPYEGHLRIYVVEPVSRWNMNNHEPYHFGSLGFAYDNALSIDYLGSYNNTMTWNGDVTQNNVMVIASVFSSDTYQAYAYPPSKNPYNAHYVDAAAAATPGNTSHNTVTENFTHTVFIEEGTATWCQYCPSMAEALYTVYQSGEYPFYFVALIHDKSPGAADRLENDYNIYGFPTAFFDGGYRVIVGGDSNPNSYRSRIRASGQRNVHDLNLTLSVEYLGNGALQVSVNIINNQTTHAPLKPRTPTGPENGHPGIKYTFTSNTTDEDGGDLFYLFDWGDGTDSGWVGPYTSGEPATAKHTWMTEGDYQIQVKANDRSDHLTDWSDPHTIHITPPQFLITVNSGIAEINATIINNGNETLPRVNWSLSVVGGIFRRINVSSNGSVENLAAGEQIKAITKKVIFGLGKIKITVTAETIIYKKDGFICGPFILIR